MTHKVERNSRYLTLAIIAVIALVAGCRKTKFPTSGGTSTPSSSPSSTATPAPSPSRSLSASPHPGGLMPPNHQIDYGYYFEDGKYGDYRARTTCHTNLYMSLAKYGYAPDSEDPPSVWLPLMEKGLREAYDAGRTIYLNVGYNHPEIPLPEVLRIAKPFWSKVKYVELDDEPGWTRPQMSRKANEVMTAMRNLGLAIPKIGVVVTESQLFDQDGVLADELDWIGVEAYVSPPGSNNSQVNVDKLNALLTRAKRRVPFNKDLIFIMQAYSRNYGWQNIDTLKDIQVPVYLAAQDDPRVVAITMFAFGRPSGTVEYPQLLQKHKIIGEAITGRICP